MPFAREVLEKACSDGLKIVKSLSEIEFSPRKGLYPLGFEPNPKLVGLYRGESTIQYISV